MMEAPTRLQYEPALLSAHCQERDQLATTSQQAVRKNHNRTKVQRATRCLCPSQTRRIQGSSSRFSWYSFSSAWVHTTHLPNCPLGRYVQQHSDRLEIKYTYCTRMLGLSVVANLSVKGGGRFPNLDSNIAFRAVVPPESPAFQLLDFSKTELGDKAGFTTSLDHAEWILQQLDVLFQARKASPRDVLPDGMTLLHVSARDIQLKNDLTLGSVLCKDWNPNLPRVITSWLSVIWSKVSCVQVQNQLCATTRIGESAYFSFRTGKNLKFKTQLKCLDL